MGLYSRDKGKRGERLWCSFCHEQGYNDVHRTAQYRGNTGAAGDVEGLPFIHCEVKYVQRLNIREAMEQSDGDANMEAIRIRKAEEKAAPHGALFTQDFGLSYYKKLPIVASKRSNEPWLVTMYAWGFVSLVSLVGDEFLDSLHVIHKASQRFSVRKVLREAVRQYEDEDGALVAIKYPRGENASLVTMYAEEWFVLYREWEAGMDLKARGEQ